MVVPYTYCNTTIHLDYCMNERDRSEYFIANNFIAHQFVIGQFVGWTTPSYCNDYTISHCGHVISFDETTVVVSTNNKIEFLNISSTDWD